eukprot:15015027-Alexandrium_andersonii.AAC.1
MLVGYCPRPLRAVRSSLQRCDNSAKAEPPTANHQQRSFALLRTSPHHSAWCSCLQCLALGRTGAARTAE